MYCQRMQKKTIHSAIIIIQEGMTSDNRRYGTKLHIKTLFKFYITKHEIVPEYIVLTSDEKQELSTR
ncbi:hypothetical protein PGB90_007401 [Kerria lacca]